MSTNPDFELVCRVTDQLGDRANADGVRSLTPEEQVPLLVWWAKGIIDNGGFE